jgi:hypothetical protein
MVCRVDLQEAGVKQSNRKVNAFDGGVIYLFYKIIKK